MGMPTFFLQMASSSDLAAEHQFLLYALPAEAVLQDQEQLIVRQTICLSQHSTTPSSTNWLTLVEMERSLPEQVPPGMAPTR